MEEILQCLIVVGVLEMAALIVANVAVIYLIKIFSYLKVVISNWQVRRMNERIVCRRYRY